MPAIKAMDRRSQDFKLEYLSWLAGLTEQINASLNPHLRGRSTGKTDHPLFIEA